MLILLTAISAHAQVEWTDYEFSYKNEEITKNLEGYVSSLDFKPALDLSLFFAKQDKTPPTAQMWVHVDGPGGVQDVIVTNTPASIDVAFGDEVSIFASGTESGDGGLATVELSGGSSESCVMGNVGSSISGLLFTNSPDPNPTDNSLYTWRLAALTIDVGNVCDPGFSYSGGSWSFSARSVNLAGLETRTAFVSIRTR